MDSASARMTPRGKNKVLQVRWVYMSSMASIPLLYGGEVANARKKLYSHKYQHTKIYFIMSLHSVILSL